MAIAGLSLLLYFDHNGNPHLARDIRDAGFDAITARDAGNERLNDDDQLQWATDHGRCLFTHDLDDFPVINRTWAGQGRSHAGIIVSLQPPKVPYGEMLRRLLNLLDTLTADDVVNRLEWLDHRWTNPRG